MSHGLPVSTFSIYPIKTTLPETNSWAPENRSSQKETSSEPTIDVQGRTVLFSGKIPLLYICARVDQLLVLAMAIPPWIRNPFSGYINQDYMVDDYDAKFGLSMSSDFFITPWICTGPSSTIWK